MMAPEWLNAVVRDFGRAAGADTLALNDRGAAAVTFETGATLRFEYTGAELVVAVTGFHATRLIMTFPGYATKISVLPEDVPDPFGGTDEEYEVCLCTIEKMLRDVFPPPKETP